MYLLNIFVHNLSIWMEEIHILKQIEHGCVFDNMSVHFVKVFFNEIG